MTDHPAAPHRLSQDEWLRRYKQRFIDVVGMTQAHADECAEAESFEVLSEYFKDDPEGAADSEMSYWDGD